MPTKKPRVNVVLDSEIYSALNKISKREGISLSLISRDLIKEALEIREDVYWQKEAERREKTFSKKDALSHEEVWG